MYEIHSKIVGWCGALAIILAYYLNSYCILSSTSIAYQLLSLTGAAGIIIISAHKMTYQSAALNVVWLFIALVAIIKTLV